MMTCSSCSTEKPASAFSRSKAKKNGLQAWCKECLSRTRNENSGRYQQNMREKRRTASGHALTALHNARQKSKNAGIPFTLTRESMPFLPVSCPCCGVLFQIGGPWRSQPSLDRIYPEDGYIPRNVHWLCRRCNQLKNNASPRELMRLATFVQELTWNKPPRFVLSDDVVVIGTREYRYVDWQKLFNWYDSENGIITHV